MKTSLPPRCKQRTYPATAEVRLTGGTGPYRPGEKQPVCIVAQRTVFDAPVAPDWSRPRRTWWRAGAKSLQIRSHGPGVGMVWPQRLLPERQRALVERQGLGELAVGSTLARLARPTPSRLRIDFVFHHFLHRAVNVEGIVFGVAVDESEPVHFLDGLNPGEWFGDDTRNRRRSRSAKPGRTAHSLLPRRKEAAE